MRCGRTGFLFLLFGLWPLLAPAAQEVSRPEALQPAAWHRAVEIVDGDTLLLDSGREVRLVGLQAPKLPLGRRGFKTWPLAEEAKAALADLALERRLGLSFTGRREDRHGRWLAHLEREDGIWIQGELLQRGLARVYAFADNRALVAEMLVLERQARRDGRGIWGHPFYALRRPAEAGAHLSSFQLVEGRVLDAAKVRGRVYLNFGADWKTDFTVSIDRKAWRLFEQAGLGLEDFEGRPIRVRGWLKSLNGPMIVATHPEQIERLTAESLELPLETAGEDR